LWKLVAEGEQVDRRWRRPPASWALLLQLLAVVLAATALAEPRLSFTERGPTTLIVDVGIAMQVRQEDGTTRFESTIEALARDARRRDAPWSLWTVADSARPVLLEVHDLARLRSTLEGLRATDRATDWSAVVERVADHVGARGRVVVVAADHAAAEAAFAGWPADNAVASVVGVGAPFVNASVAELSVTPEGTRTGRWSIEASVHAGDPATAPTEALITYTPDGADREVELAREPLRYTLAGTARVRVAADAVRPGVLSVRIASQDVYPADDALSVRIDPEPAPRRVAVVGTGPGAEAARRVLTAFGAEVVAPGGGSEPVDLTIVAGAADPFEQGTAPEGAVLWLAAARTVADPLALPRRDAGVATWDTGHPLAATAPWGRLDAAGALDLPLPEDAAVVVDGITGPLVVSRTVRGRREAWYAFDLRDPTWTQSATFLAAMGDAFAWLVPERHAVSFCIVGAACRVPVPVAAEGGTVAQFGTTVARWPTHDDALPARVESGWVPDRSGIAAWRTGDAEGWIAIQPSRHARAALLAASTADSVPTAPAGVRWPETRPWVLLLAVVLAVESAVAGLGRERFLRPEGWRAGGRLGRRRMGTAIATVASIAALIAAIASATWPVQWRAQHLVVIGEHAPERWPEGRVRTVDVGGAGPLDVEAAVDEARAHAAAIGGAELLWATTVPVTRGELARVVVSPDDGASPIDVLEDVPASLAGDVAVVRLDVDRTAYAGDVVDLTAVVTASTGGTAQLRVLRDGDVRIERRIDLLEGASLLRVPMATPTAGTERWRVEVRAAGDPVPGNDTAEHFIEVRGAPKVWLVTSERERADRFAEALELQGLTATVRAPFGLPSEPAGYAGVDVVVLSNVPALEISTGQQEVLEAWVRDRGGALVLTGGERSFGPGGYVETPLDRVSPLSAKVPREAPEVALLFVLDRSGSMQQRVGTATRLDIAKEATLTAMELLGPSSQVAIVVFDEEATVLLPWTSTADLAPIEGALANLVPGGGTALFHGLTAARDLLGAVDSATRHVVLMTDGLSTPDDLVGVTAQIVGLEATVSTVAIGQGADVERVREIARAGGGAAHVTTDFRALPGILAQEAMLLSGDPVVREVVTPRRTTADPGLMEGLPQVWPPLAGFVETTAKVDSDVLLVDDADRPLLAAWRYGAGRVVAFASHAVGPWADAWTAVEAFPRWWGQWLRWTVQPTVAPGLDLDVRRVGDAFVVAVVARDDATDPLPGLDLVGTWTPQTGSVRRVSLVETERGRYEGVVPIEPGTGTLVIDDASGTWPSVRRPLSHAYPAAWAGESVATGTSIAAATGGRTGLDANELAPPRPTIAWAPNPAWRPWVMVALCLYVMTLATRYVPGWWRRRRAPPIRNPTTSASPTRSVPPIAQ
jgi:uncharacterized protein YegL